MTDSWLQPEGFTTVVKRGNELNTTELYEILHLRAEVFVVEQDCPYQDLDGQDLGPQYFHVMVREGNNLAAYIRVMFNNPQELEVQIGRVVVGLQFRKRSLGRVLLREALAVACDEAHPYAPKTAMLHGQSHLVKFYSEFGFKVEGDQFLEDGIPHYLMRRWM